MNSVQESSLPYKIQKKESIYQTTEKKGEYKEQITKKEEQTIERATTTTKPRPKTLQEIEQEMRKGKETTIRSDELDFF